MQVIGIEVGEFSSDFEAVFILWIAHEVQGHVFDDGHVLRSVVAAEPGQIVVEDDIEDPMQAVFDAPVGAHRRRESLGVETSGGEVVAPFVGKRAVALTVAFDHGDHGQVREARLVGIAAIREQPVDFMADDMAALLDPAVLAICG